ncbi:telomere length and silencing protein 1 homolog [Lucilia sericata]|uniref:telomere length and silencing protein 1 homolog n=1 Tax=Lucilia sericata TaxID=13632 RepID=UPI0018A8454C|nr:telomere length and silencing protein 1 homolog [Lucilia sericata]
MSEVAKEQLDSNEGEKIVFKKKVRKNLRQRRNSDDEPSEEPLSLEEIKERQKLRERPHGVSIIGLALGKKLAPEEEITLKDPFNVKTGGLVNMQSLKSGNVKESDDAYDVGIGTQFSAETNKRDEDEEMMKYIEQELHKRKGLTKSNPESETGADPQKYLTPEEAALYALPEHLRQSSSHRSEEMLSNQMLNGIPEVDLGIDAKIKNIEATEEAKQKLLQDQKNKKDGPSQFVPTNMAVNFMQHNRFNIEENNDPKRRFQQQRKPAEGGGAEGTQPQNPLHQVGPNGVKRATDDYHYDKFKKQFRRY